MGPVAEALDNFQTDKKISIGYLLPTKSILMKKHESFENLAHVKHCKSMIKTKMDSIKKRFQFFFTDQELIVATLVNQKFKTCGLTENIQSTDQLNKKEKKLVG